jgi:hypothetical protein
MASILQAARRAARDCRNQPPSSEHGVKRLSRSASFSAFVEALEKYGCVIIKDFTDKSTLAKADDEITPWLEKQDGGVKVGGKLSPCHLLASTH